MAKEYQLLLTVVLMGLSIALYAASRSLKRPELARILAFTAFVMLGCAGWLMGGLIPVVGNWISFLFIAAAGLGILVLVTGAGDSQQTGKNR